MIEQLLENDGYSRVLQLVVQQTSIFGSHLRSPIAVERGLANARDNPAVGLLVPCRDELRQFVTVVLPGVYWVEVVFRPLLSLSVIVTAVTASCRRKSSTTERPSSHFRGLSGWRLGHNSVRHIGGAGSEQHDRA